MKNSKKPTVAVIFGGMGAEHEISVLGKDYVLRSIDRQRFFVLPVFIERDGEWYIEDRRRRLRAYPMRKNGKAGFLVGHRFKRVELAFPILHGDFGEDGRVQGLLECLGFSFVGCKTVASAVSIDKCFTKSVAEAAGIPTVPWIQVNGTVTKEKVREVKEALGLPVFIKPARLGSSIGAGIARTDDELLEALEKASALGGGRVIAEKLIAPIRELEVAFLELFGERYITPAGEVVAGAEFYGYEQKYADTSVSSVTPRARVPFEVEKRLLDYSARLADALDIRGLSRLDFFLCEDKLYFNEINTVPGMTESSLYPSLIREHLGFDLVNRLIEDALGVEP